MSVHTTLLIVTYRGDAPWIPYLLKSIGKYATGFNEYVIAIPDVDVPIFQKFGLTKERIVPFSEAGFANGFMAHQYWICNSHKLVPSTDFVVHIDSDCIFTAPVTPETYIDMDSYRAINLCTKYSSIDSPWKPGVEMLLGREVEWETMRRHGNCYTFDTYPLLNAHILGTHGKELIDIVRPMGRKANLSEFNLLGAYGFYYMPEYFKFIDTEVGPVPPNPIFQSWSHLIRVGNFDGNLIQHLESLAVSAPPDYAKPAAEALEQLSKL